MGVYLGGIETLLVVLDGLVVEAVEVVGLKEAVGGLPLSIAMFYVVAVAVVVVAHLVEANLDVPLAKLHDGSLEWIVHGDELAGE